MKKRVNLYSSERYHLGLHPQFSKIIKADTEEELEKMSNEMKKNQADINIAFKKKLIDKKRKAKISDIDDKANSFRDISKNIVINKNVSNLEYSSNIKIHLDSNTGNTAVLLGSSKAGKSYFLTRLINKLYSDSKHITTLFSINSNAPAYDNLKKNIIKCNKFDQNGEILIRQEQQLNNNLTKNKNNKPIPFINIFDDVITMKHNRLFNELVLTFRNSMMSSFVALQYPMLLSKQLRANVNNVYLFRFNSDEIIEDVIRIYLRGHFRKILGGGTMIDFIDLYKKITSKYGIIHLVPALGIIEYIRLN